VKRRAVLRCGAIATALSWLGPLAACGPSTIPDRRQQLLASWGTNTLLPLYQEFERRLVTLDERAQDFLLHPAQDRLDAARAAWWAAREPWKQAEVFAFGPYSDDPFRLGPNIDFWPARPDTIQAVLAGTDALDARAASLLGAAAKGLPVVEYLLFQPGLDLVSEFGATARRGEYLGLLTQALLHDIRMLVAAWDPQQGNYLSQLTEAGRGSTIFQSLTLALGSVVNRMGFLLEHIRGEKLGRPLGAPDASSAQPEKVESRFSERSIADILDNLSGLELAFFGGSQAAERGLHGYLLFRGKDLSELVRTRLDAARASLQGITMPLALAVLEERVAVAGALTSFAALQRAFQVDVLNALSLSVAFGGNDGD
jgi:predicted lipoprotein